MINDVTVIGDVHGCYDTLIKLLDKIPKEHKKKLCFAGDLIDRGPMSRQVVEFVVGNGHDCVAGNHELMMAEWLGNYSDMLWLGNGGDKALDSYYEKHNGIKGNFDKDKFQEHQKWMRQLPIVLEYPDVKTPDGRSLVVSHSVCHNYWSAYKSDDNARVIRAKQEIPWTRDFRSIKDAGFFNVIGHTPDEDNPKIKSCYANIDTGAFIGYGGWKKFKKGGLGKLTALHVPTMTVYQQECCEDEGDVLSY